VGRDRADWGDTIDAHLPFYQKECLDTALSHVTGELKRVEQRLRARKKELGSAVQVAASGLVAHSDAMLRVIDLAQLENAVERAVVLARGDRIEVDDLPEEIGLAPPSAYAPGDVRSLDEVERDYILAVLRANDGNRAQAAEQLKIGTATLYRKLKQYEGAGRA
jgi:hypothetical protein